MAGEADVDLRPEAFTVTPLVIDNGGTVEVSVDVCNVGNNGSTPSVVRVFLSPDPSLDAFDRELVGSRVPPIDPDACLTVRAEVAAECDTFNPNYYLFVSVDDNGDITESNEENNVDQLDELLQINALICDCEPDDFEPNDTPANADFLNPNIGAWEGLTMCDRAGEFYVDYYLIPLLEDQTVRVEARFENDRGNLDAQLFALDRATVLDRSETDGDIEAVSFVRVRDRGNYLLRIQGRTEEDRNVYSLDLQVSSPDEGTDLTILDVTVDDAEPFLGAEVEVCFDVVNLGDTPAPPSLARVYLSDDTRIDPVEDVLMGALEIEGVDDRLSRCVRVNVPDDLGGGERYIGVVADARNDIADELDESNNAGVSPALNINATCFDALEPNNSLEAPRLLELVTEPPVEFGSLLACSDNRDVYEICASDGDFLSVSVDFDVLDGDIDMKLYDAGGTQIDRSEGTEGTESVGVDFVNGDQCYRVELYVAGRDREVPYTMTVDSGRAPDDLICSRIEEPNDGFGTAARLRDYLDDCMAVCPVEDEDYYYVNLSPGTELEVSLVPEPGAEDVPSELRLTLWGPSRNFLPTRFRPTRPCSRPSHSPAATTSACAPTATDLGTRRTACAWRASRAWTSSRRTSCSSARWRPLATRSGSPSMSATRATRHRRRRTTPSISPMTPSSTPPATRCSGPSSSRRLRGSRADLRGVASTSRSACSMAASSTSSSASTIKAPSRSSASRTT